MSPASYTPHVQPIIRVYRYQGLRTQEALQLQWNNLDLKRETMFVQRTKNHTPRTLKMHPAVASDIARLWKDRDRPTSGHVFLNRHGVPYSDTRDYDLPGGNPLRSAHMTALKRAKVAPNGGADFRIHDWRHHWASWLRMEGADLLTIKELGGWKSLIMVERYSAVSAEHHAAVLARLK